MMNKIYKYELQMAERQSVELPKGAGILDAQFQGDVLCMWACIDDDRPEREEEIYIYGTGASIDQNNICHISTVQKDGFVWHIFHRGPSNNLLEKQ